MLSPFHAAIRPGIPEVIGDGNFLIYQNITGPYWEPERKYIDEAYQTLPFPFEHIDVPSFEMPGNWTFSQMMGYLNTWSAVKRYEQEYGVNPLTHVATDLERAYSGEERRRVVFSLFVKAGRKGDRENAVYAPLAIC